MNFVFAGCRSFLDLSEASDEPAATVSNLCWFWTCPVRMNSYGQRFRSLVLFFKKI